MRAAGLPPTVQVVKVMAVYKAVAPESAAKTAIAAEQSRQRLRHRALPDAEGLLWIYRRLADGGAAPRG
ncbi:MAG: hypothetical protein ACREFY_19110 [Acetobacteraceae bacterium]